MNEAIATPRRLVDLVETQPGSVVSRVIFRNAGGTLTAFAFAEGEGLDEHTNPNDAIVHVLDGRCTVIVDGVTHVVGEGEMLHLAASVPHTIVGGPPFRMLLLLLRTGDEPGRPSAGSRTDVSR
jgi:quercetin dioxygenase-like cupin family protein